MTDGQVTDYQIKDKQQSLQSEAEKSGYRLNPDEAFTLKLAEGLLVNISRYGYQVCPCRLAAGVKTDDLDIICPCDYRDADISEYGSCFCGLYISNAVSRGQQSLQSVPERRGLPVAGGQENMEKSLKQELSQPVWRCKVCGYLCARPDAPERCPICKVGRERFERFI